MRHTSPKKRTRHWKNSPFGKKSKKGKSTQSPERPLGEVCCIYIRIYKNNTSTEKQSPEKKQSPEVKQNKNTHLRKKKNKRRSQNDQWYQVQRRRRPRASKQEIRCESHPRKIDIRIFQSFAEGVLMLPSHINCVVFINDSCPPQKAFQCGPSVYFNAKLCHFHIATLHLSG